MLNNKICTRCVMDQTIPEIQFDEHGECQFCKIHDVLEMKYPLGPQGEQRLEKVIEKIKLAGKGKPYDCLCGTSGGRDSTWTLLLAKKYGLRPLAVHFDNGWNSEIAVRNIKNATEILKIDLETVVANWDEFKDIQMAFLKASVPDVEIPTDVAIHKVMHKIAAQEGIQYILNGHSFRTEGVAPRGWTYMDGRYIRSIQKQFGQAHLKDFHNFNVNDLIYYSFIKAIKVIPILNYLPYNQKEVSDIITKELNWEYYGGHHHESTYTEFIQSYLLPQKFNIDKRKTEWSALIRSGQMTRVEALDKIQSTPYQYRKELIDYIVSKFSMSKEEWEVLYHLPVKSYHDYPTYYPVMLKFKKIIKKMTELNLLPELLYLKYLF
jgi:N-acetyl sugar amidotransferase